MGSEQSTNDIQIAWTDLVRFLRQLSHDLRNHLNAAELQAVFIGELASDPEIKSEVKRLREIVSGLAKTLQKLSGDLGEAKPNVMRYGIADFITDMRKKIAHDFPKESEGVKWEMRVSDEVFEIDPQLLQSVFTELFTNAFQHDRSQGEISAVGHIDQGKFIFTLSEPKTHFDLPTENWGREPLQKVGRGHYGLGLHRARGIVEGHHGELRAGYNSKDSLLVTTIILPLSQSKT